MSAEISINERFVGLLLNNPLEPVIANTEANGVRLVIPKSYLTPEYASLVIKPSVLTEATELNLPELEQKPDLSFAQGLRKDQALSLFNENHQNMAGRLTSLFMDAKDFTELMALGAYVKDRVNSELFVYAFTTALQHRQDTKNIRVKSMAELFPRKFLAPSVLRKAKEIAHLHKDSSQGVSVKKFVIINYCV